MHLFTDSRERRLNVRPRSSLFAYGVSVLSVALALFLTVQVPALHTNAPFLLCLLAIIGSAWYGGVGPGLSALSLATVSTSYWVLPPAQPFALTTWQVAQLARFLIVTSAMLGLVAHLQKEKTTVLTQREALRLTLASIGDAVIVTDAQGTVRWLNEVAARLTGWSSAAAIGHALPEVFPILDEQTRLPVENPVQQVVRTGRVARLANHTILVGKDGVERTIEDSTAPIRDEVDSIHGVILVFRDITQRRHEEALRQAAEERFTKAFQASPDAFLISRQADGVILEVNDSWARMFGYSRAEAVGQTALALQLYVNPTDWATILQQGQSHGHVRDFEMSVRTQHGEVRQVSLALETLQIHGEPCLLTILHDITKRKQAEAALRASEEKFAKAFNASPLILTITALADGRLIEVNESFVQLTRYTRAEVLGRTPVELGLWVEPNQHTEGLVLLRAGRLPRNGEARFRMKDGSERTCLMSAELLTLDGQLCVLTTLTDITPRKQAEEVLRLSEQRLRQLADAIPQIIWVSDAAGVLQYVNQGWLAYSGLTLAENLRDGVWPTVHPDDVACNRAVWEQAIQNGQAYESELRLRNQAGMYRWHLERGVPVRDANGVVQAWYTSATDIDDRKRAERQQQFLSELSLSLSLLNDPAPMQQIVVAHLGAYLDASGCCFNAIDLATNQATLLTAWSQAREPLSAVALPRADEAAALADAYVGHTRVVADVTRDNPMLTFQPGLHEQGVAAYVSVPCLRKGQWTASLQVWQHTPRSWRTDEVQLVENVVQHVWPLIEKAHAEQALQQSNIILSGVLESSTDAIFVRDLGGHYLLVNTAGADQVGLPKEAIIGQHYTGLFSPTEAEAMQQDDRPVLEQGLIQTVEHLTQHAGGTRYWHTRKMPLRNPAGEIIGVISSARDFTERKQAEEALRVSEEKFAKAFHASPQALCITRVTDGRYLDVNESFAQLVDWPLPAIMGHTSFDVGIWTDPAQRAATNQRILEQGSNRDFEHRFCTRTGEWRDIRAAGVALEINGEPCILSLLNDVTERKRAEMALRENEARFRATFEQAGVGMAQISPAHRYLRVNARLCEITGYAQEALLQKSYQDITYADDLVPNVTLANQLFAGELTSYQLEKRYIRADGGLVWVHITASAVADPQGSVQYQIAVIEDITARKAAEARLVFLAETSAVLAGSLDYAVTLQQVAEQMVPQLADLCTVEILGPERTIRPVAAAHVNPAKLRAVQQLRTLYPPQFDDQYGIGHVLQTGDSAFYPTIRGERLLALAPDATYRTLLQQVEFRSTLIVPLQVRGQTLGALTLAWTESDRHYTTADLQLAEEVAKRAALAVDNARLYQAARQAEGELRQLNERLEQHVATRTSELQRSNRELDQFAYVASHDLKAPLRAIDQLASWISQDSAAVLPAPSQAHLTKLRGRVQRMDKLLNDLLDYSRAGRQHHPVEQVNTGEVVRNLLELLAPPAGLMIDLVEPLPILFTERIPLETVLRNLIGNALKHHDQPQTGHVTIAAIEQTRMVEFRVTDDGPGIEPQYHARIFQLFQTLKPRDQVEGSGMGLAIVKKLIESYGGVITVESSAGQGATFRFTWPKSSLPDASA